MDCAGVETLGGYSAKGVPTVVISGGYAGADEGPEVGTSGGYALPGADGVDMSGG